VSFAGAWSTDATLPKGSRYAIALWIRRCLCSSSSRSSKSSSLSKSMGEVIFISKEEAATVTADARFPIEPNLKST